MSLTQTQVVCSLETQEINALVHGYGKPIANNAPLLKLWSGGLEVFIPEYNYLSKYQF